MAYVSDSNLTQFWGLAKDYINAEDCRFANWQKTEKAGAVSCYPVGETPLLPTVDFMFTEVPPASGDKGPENPSTITGVTQAKVTRCGKNLMPFPYYHSTTSIGSLSFTVNSDGSITVNGTNDTGSAAVFRLSYSSVQLPLKNGVTYRLSGCPQGGSSASYKIYIIASPNTAFSAAADFGSGVSIIPTKDCYGLAYIQVNSGVTINNLVFKPQVEVGSAATSFEPYAGTDYTIDLGGTFYGGSINLATGVMTVTYASQIVDSTMPISASGFAESTSYYTVRFYLQNKETTPGSTPDLSRYACDKLVVIRNNDVQEGFIVYGNSLVVGLRLSKTTLGLGDGLSLDQVKPAVSSWLGNNPLFVVYPVLSPTTVQLTPQQILSLAQTDKYTPRLNTLYTDASAVQVGYAKSPIRSEYELTQAIIATEGGE